MTYSGGELARALENENPFHPLVLVLLLLLGTGGLALRSVLVRPSARSLPPDAAQQERKILAHTRDEAPEDHTVPRTPPIASAGAYQDWALAVVHATSPDETFTLLHTKGLRLSRAAFDKAYAQFLAHVAEGSGRNLEGNAIFFIADFAEAWLREDYAAAARWILDDTPAHNNRWTLFWRLANEWRRQPGVRETLLARYAGHPNFPDLQALSLQDTDPAAALAYVRDHRLLSLQPSQIVNGAFANLWNKDVATATTWALDPANADYRRSILRALGRDTSPSARAAAAALLETFDGAEKHNALNHYATQMSFADPAAGAALMADTPGFLTADRGNLAMFSQALRLLAEKDPEAAARFAAARPLPAEALADLGRGWAGRDSSAARAWAEGLGGDAREAALQGVIAGLAAHDPAAALILAAEAKLADPAQARQAALTAFAQRDPAGAADWIATKAAAAVRPIAQSDPEAAIHLLARAGATPSPENAYWLARTLDARLGAPDQALAASLADRPEARRAAEAGTVAALLVRDEAAARAQAETFRPGQAAAVLFEALSRDRDYFGRNQPAQTMHILSAYTPADEAARAEWSRVAGRAAFFLANSQGPEALVAWAETVRDRDLAPLAATAARQAMDEKTLPPALATRLSRLP
jgi:hypothetical protein